LFPWLAKIIRSPTKQPRVWSAPVAVISYSTGLPINRRTPRRQHHTTVTNGEAKVFLYESGIHSEALGSFQD
jgi:hypothetical protein